MEGETTDSEEVEETPQPPTASTSKATPKPKKEDGKKPAAPTPSKTTASPSKGGRVGGDVWRWEERHRELAASVAVKGDSELDDGAPFDSFCFFGSS